MAFRVALGWVFTDSVQGDEVPAYVAGGEQVRPK